MTIKRALAYALSSPFFVLFVGVDVVKLPLMPFILVLWAILCWIGYLLGERDVGFWAGAASIALVGTLLWWTMMGNASPKWA